MYGRTLGDRVLSFGHEGVLYRKSFVMYARETRSLWVHTTGQAVKGELRGAKLEFLPSEVVPWNVWTEGHPDTLVLDRGGEGQGFMGTFGLPDETSEFGLSVGSGTEATLYPYELLLDLGVINDGPRLLVHLDRSESVRAYKRGDRTFELTEEGWLVDDGGATWDAMTGECRDGDAEPLERLPATAWLIDRWEGFYPDGEVFEE